jgi:hypothetical protein
MSMVGPPLRQLAEPIYLPVAPVCFGRSANNPGPPQKSARLLVMAAVAVSLSSLTDSIHSSQAGHLELLMTTLSRARLQRLSRLI